MSFSISAELLLGTYRGHSSDGGIERVPSVARLHSALLCAAGFGPRAQPRDTGLAPSDADDVALRWLEQHPPDEVSIPALRVNQGDATAYRYDGTLYRTKGAATIKKLAKSPSGSVAVNGRFTWTWREPPPPEIAGALTALCPDVPYLGTTEAPVRLTSSTTAPEPTHTLDPEAGLFAGAGVNIDLPVTGRVDELAAAHVAMRGRPTVRQDATRTDEDSASPVPPRSATRAARYAPARVALGDVPWPEALVIPLDRAIAEQDKVRWAVAAHRALIRIIGDGAPPLVTGAYPPGSARPANRLALQLLDPGWVPGVETSSVLAVLLPRDADPAELGAALDGIGRLRSIRGPRGAVAHCGPAEYCSGDRFWSERPRGTVRLWRTASPAIPDTRGYRDWTFAHAALLSLGFVWQGNAQLPEVPGRAEARYRAMVAAVSEAGAAVLDVEALRTSAVRDYAHRVNEHAVVRPYRATLSLGDLGGECTVQAIGQSRHLGGGLLVPVDLPEGAVFHPTGLDPTNVSAPRVTHGRWTR